MEVEIWMLEEFELNENMKATEDISIDIIKEDFQLYWKKVKEKIIFHITTKLWSLKGGSHVQGPW